MLVTPDQNGKWAGVWNFLDPEDLRHWRTDRGLSQRTLSALLGMGERTVMRWESGEVLAPAYLILALIALDQGLRLDNICLRNVPGKDGPFMGIDRKRGPSIWSELAATTPTVSRQQSRVSTGIEDVGKTADWIRQLVGAFTRSQVARMAGVTENKVQQWELGDISSSDVVALQQLVSRLRA